jgi:small-conductance mechanosensitive channel
MFFIRILDWVKGLSPDVLLRFLRIAIYVVGGFVFLRFAIILLRNVVLKKSSPQVRMITQKAVGYVGTLIIVMAVLGELGVQLTAILGAAGILGIAIGFASQTSFSNIISGIFLISEKPFTIGDTIRIGSTTGEIQSIDLLSIKIRTLDNLFVRIPNEKILNSEVTNITRFPIRRMDFIIQVAYKENLEKVHRLLLEIARANRFCLDDPDPVILFTDFKDSGISILFGLWFAKEDFMNLRNSIFIEIQRVFAREKVEMPFPHRSLHAGAATDPFPVRIVEEAPGGPRPAP